jgi:hypothetical protein
MYRKLAILLVVILPLGGCAALQNIETAVSVATVSVANPVTKERLNQLENVAILVFSGLNGWRQACISGAIPSSCKGQIAAVQVYTRKIPPYLTQLRAFVNSNDQINAVTVYNNVMGLITTVKAQAASNGVTISTTGS